MTGRKEYKRVAVAVVRNEERKLLVQQRKDSSIPAANYKWEFPGGVIEPGETAEQAAIRECLEETGCTATITRFLFTESKVWDREGGSQLHVEVSMFEAKHVAGQARALDTKKVAQVQWVTKEQAAKLDALPNVYEALKYLD